MICFVDHDNLQLLNVLGEDSKSHMEASNWFLHYTPSELGAVRPKQLVDSMRKRHLPLVKNILERQRTVSVVLLHGSPWRSWVSEKCGGRGKRT